MQMNYVRADERKQWKALRKKQNDSRYKWEVDEQKPKEYRKIATALSSNNNDTLGV